MRSIVNDSGRTLDHAIDALYDPINALQRQVLDIERSYRDLAQRDDLTTDTLGAPTTPAEAIAGMNHPRFCAASNVGWSSGPRPA